MSQAEQVRDGSVVRATAVFESIKQWLYQHETAQGELNGISLEVSPSTLHPDGRGRFYPFHTKNLFPTFHNLNLRA